MSGDLNQPVGLKTHLRAAIGVVDALPWHLGRDATQHKATRGRASALAHQVAALLGTGWSVNELGDVLRGVRDAVNVPDSAAQEKRWRAALKRAKRSRGAKMSHADAESGRLDSCVDPEA